MNLRMVPGEKIEGRVKVNVKRREARRKEERGRVEGAKDEGGKSTLSNKKTSHNFIRISGKPNKELEKRERVECCDGAEEMYKR